MFGRLTLANAFLLVFILPMALALSSLAFYFSAQLKQWDAAAEASQLLTSIEKLDEIARNHAVERGLTAGFLASGGAQFSAVLQQARAESDAAIAAVERLEAEGLDGIPETRLENILSPVLALSAQAPALRQAVDELNAPNAFRFYSEINATALDAMGSVNSEIDDRGVTRSLNALIAITWTRERLGQIRGRLNAYYASGEADQVAYIRVSQYIANLAEQRRVFNLYASDSAKAAAATILQTKEFRDMQSALDDFLASEGTQSLDDPTNGEWFQVATSALEKYGDLGKTIYSDSVDLAEDRADSILREIFIYSLAFTAVLVVFSVSIASIFRRVRRTLRQNDLLAAAIEASPVGLTIADPHQVDAPITYINPGFTEITGYSAEEAIGRNCRFLQGPETSTEQLQQIRQAIRQQRAVRLELLNYRKDGTSFWNQLYISPVFDKRRDLIAYVGIQQDATERKRLDRLKDEFISTVSHELRTPLTSISGSLGLILGGASGEVSVQSTKLLKIAQKNSQRLGELINDLLDFDKIAAGKLEFATARHDIGDLVAHSIEANKQYGADKNIHFKLHGNNGSIMVNVDERRLQQVLSNLLSNAVKFSPNGATVQVTVSLRDDWVRVSVSDEGPGIPQSFRRRIFEKFSQADGSSTRNQGGTGLGLAISRELIIRMGGRIDFQSTEGRGAVFWFDLPTNFPDSQYSNQRSDSSTAIAARRRQKRTSGQGDAHL
jgi:PAS domain S-box-containing protein